MEENIKKCKEEIENVLQKYDCFMRIGQNIIVQAKAPVVENKDTPEE